MGVQRVTPLSTADTQQQLGKGCSWGSVLYLPICCCYDCNVLPEGDDVLNHDTKMTLRCCPTFCCCNVAFAGSLMWPSTFPNPVTRAISPLVGPRRTVMQCASCARLASPLKKQSLKPRTNALCARPAEVVMAAACAPMIPGALVRPVLGMVAKAVPVVQ
jgi:hypothetical protein